VNSRYPLALAAAPTQEEQGYEEQHPRHARRDQARGGPVAVQLGRGPREHDPAVGIPLELAEGRPVVEVPAAGTQHQVDGLALIEVAELEPPAHERIDDLQRSPALDVLPHTPV